MSGAHGRWRPALLSGLVLPGLGQLANRQPWKALAFSGPTLALLVVLVRRVALEALVRLPDDPTEIDPALPFRLAHEIQRDNAAFFLWVTLGLLALWAGSVYDAWRVGRRGEGRDPGPEASDARH